MNPEINVALASCADRMLEDLGQPITIDGAPAQVCFSCDDDMIKVAYDQKVELGSIVKRGKEIFKVTHVSDGAMKKAMIHRVLEG